VLTWRHEADGQGLGAIVSIEGSVQQKGHQRQYQRLNASHDDAPRPSAPRPAAHQHQRGECQVGGQIPGVGHAQGAEGQGQQRGVRHTLRRVPRLSFRQAHRQPRGRHGEGQVHHVGMQIGEEKAKKGELVNGVGDDARGIVPVLEGGQLRPSREDLAEPASHCTDCGPPGRPLKGCAADDAELLKHLHQAAQVADPHQQ